MSPLNINRGFETMISKPKTTEKKSYFKNNISFCLFKRQFKFSFEVVKGDD